MSEAAFQDHQSIGVSAFGEFNTFQQTFFQFLILRHQPSPQRFTMQWILPVAVLREHLKSGNLLLFRQQQQHNDDFNGVD